MKRDIISDINEIQLFTYRINCKKNDKNWIEPIEVKLLCWIFNSST
jgi:hypothetical protein